MARPGGEILAALTAAGPFAAFMSTASGLLVSVSGTLSYDLRLPRRQGQPDRAGPEHRMRMFRNAAFAGMLVRALLALATMAGVSLRDRRHPVDVDAQMLALHAPEELELEPARA